MRRSALNTLMILGLALLSGCGFQLRGQAALPFDSAYVDAKPDSILGGLLRNQLDLRSKLASQRDKAGIIILLADETRDKTILTLSGAGKVQEYRLVHKITVSASGQDGKELLAPTPIRQSRDFSYNNQQILAGDSLEDSLHHDMDQDTLQQIMRRLAFVHK
jgi:LPS-assembly lipoprotein